MGLIATLVFVGVFALVALPLIGASAGPGKKAKQVLATLDSALATEHVETRAEVMNLRKETQVSSIPWLNRRLLQFELTPYLHRLLEQSGLKWKPGRLLAVCAACFAFPAYAADLRFNSLPLALLAGLALGLAPLGWVLHKRKKRFNAFQQGLPEALDLMVSGLRAGHSLIAAMGLVARECPDPVGSEFKTCFEEQNYGLELKTAMDNLTTRVPMQDLRIVVTAIMIQKESGGNLAEVLDKTAYVIRERFRLKRQVMVHTAQGRLTGWILTCLPLVLGIGLYLINPKMMSVLWTRAIGVKLLWTAAGMTVLGGLIINHIVNMDV
jgi:tight adherence protein B